MTADEFYALARERLSANPHWRYGQALFNTLLDVRPDLATEIRGTIADPFFAQEHQAMQLRAFGAFVNERLK